ncbi:DNA-binding transcriptional regulator, PadR family [Dethiosulfatibacter aminovorans DSM 17477]|uniref:DNA-binding transcriptional regulator, PadR family n=1 Tax=Dethiosulfatibacter aminovorans DSM 17477 TaxID=1121476 RepID=A0A1M6F0S9_9FIRM|nr:helix-turn-helix transcriptional regulator [Dethiosulfatibacter aminovorans]SHI91338.1 DNA-binding transcriptional regulator, PadR family [Dethiosulfatibacter aminovorans DSM 17477]
MTEDKIMESLIQELRRGMLVLSVMSQLKDYEYGYTLAVKLKEKGLAIEQNTLYPLLRRLEGKGVLESTWKLEDSRQRRYYRLNERGAVILKRLTDEWMKMVETTNGLLDL